MKIKANSVEEYLSNIPKERQSYFSELREVILNNIPKGFKEELNYGMIGYVVPHDLYTPGYHCDPKLPLPFLNIANQKNFIALYHMGIYANPELMEWFTQEYKTHVPHKLDMGKSCIRFKKMDQIPYELIGALVGKMTPMDWIGIYEEKIKR
ncbi:MAG: DUF1801 domain-containing protein [Cyclobacteriaceae bacterium]